MPRAAMSGEENPGWEFESFIFVTSESFIFVIRESFIFLISESLIFVTNASFIFFLKLKFHTLTTKNPRWEIQRFILVASENLTFVTNDRFNDCNKKILDEKWMRIWTFVKNYQKFHVCNKWKIHICNKKKNSHLQQVKFSYF